MNQVSSEIQCEMILLLPRLRRFAYALTGSLDDADDLVQAACERALTRLHQFEIGTRLDSWMFRIIQTISIDQMRRSKTVKFSNDLLETYEFPDDSRIHETVEARNELEIVRKEIARLPEEQRAAIALVTVDGMSYNEAAETLNIPIGTVMSRLARGRRKLAEALEARSIAPDLKC